MQGILTTKKYQTSIDQLWRLEGNASYQTNKSNSGQDDIGIAPNIMLKQGISASWHSLQTGIFASYLGVPTKIRELNDSVNNANSKAASYVLVSLQLTSPLDDLTGVAGLDMSFYVDNVLDEEICYPEIARKRVNSFPLRKDRGYFLTIQYQP